MISSKRWKSRRQFLKLLAGSPLLTATPLLPGWMVDLVGARGNRFQAARLPQEGAAIASAAEALEVADFEKLAHQMLLPEHWAYLATGVDDDSTYRANLAGFRRFQIRPRRLVDVSKLDMSTDLFGVRWETPIVLCPVASLKGFHTDGEKGVARAARAGGGFLQVLSTQTSTAIEEVNTARGQPVWYQLYAQQNWEATLGMIKRVEAAGCPALVWTIDLLGGRNTVTFNRAQPREGVRAEFCQHCHKDLAKPMYAGLQSRGIGVEGQVGRTIFDWNYVKRLKDATPMKLLLKGIVTREDAELAVAMGADGLIVSNHGGRAESSGRSTIEALPEVAAGVAGRIPVILDSGVRRGTDIFKALALGADAVGIGRPYVWGLAAFGEDGVERVLTLLRRELQLAMRQTGATSIAQMRRGGYVVDRLGDRAFPNH